MLANITANSTSNNGSISSADQLIGTILFSLICSVGAVGNVLVLVTLVRWRDMRTPCNLLIANIAFVDLIVAIIMSPLRLIEIAGLGWIFGGFLCHALAPLQDGIVAVSAVSHTLIAIERYRAILMPFKPRLNARKVKISIFFIWIGCYMGASLPIVFFMRYERKGDIMTCLASGFPAHQFYIYALYLVIVFMAVPLILQTTSYIMIVRFLQSRDAVQDYQQASFTASNPSQKQQNSSRQRIKKKKRLVRMLVYLMVVFQLCYTPRGILMLVFAWHRWIETHPAFMYVNIITIVLFYFKHIINPFILYCMSQDFKNGLVTLLLCRIQGELISDAGTGSGKRSTQKTQL